MRRRDFLKRSAALAAGTAIWPRVGQGAAPSVDSLPQLKGELTLYLGRGEGGLYEQVLAAIEKRNPDFKLNIRRGPTAALANAIVAEAGAGVRRADLFWAVDSGAIGLVNDAGLAQALPEDLTQQLQPQFRYPGWIPVSGRIRTLPFHTGKQQAADIPKDIMALPESGLSMGWAPAYASFQSFVTAMRLLQGDDATASWLQAVQKNAKSYAGELGVVMGTERGEVDLGFANHYYTLRLKNGKPNARVALAFTRNDAGCLVNASGILALAEGELPVNFIRYLLTREVQSYLAREAYEIPLAQGIAPPAGLPELSTVMPPEVDLTKLADLRPTLDLMRNAGVL
ncbi:MAG: extracellular solute-binding protein [Pseudomonadota bacterium]